METREDGTRGAVLARCFDDQGKNFQRIYDITERVLPRHLDTTKPSEQKEKEFFIRKALGALGVATERDINRYIKIAGRLKKWIDNMFTAGEILKIEIEDVNRPY